MMNFIWFECGGAGRVVRLRVYPEPVEGPGTPKRRMGEARGRWRAVPSGTAAAQRGVRDGESA
jgi:hypothetical protein